MQRVTLESMVNQSIDRSSERAPWILARSKALAARLRTGDGVGSDQQVTSAYRLLFDREPTREELALAREFLVKPALGETSRWEQYCQLLLASNEMFYVD